MFLKSKHYGIQIVLFLITGMVFFGCLFDIDGIKTGSGSGKITSFELVAGNKMIIASWTATVGESADYCVALTVYPAGEDSSKYKSVVYDYSDNVLLTSYIYSSGIAKTENFENDRSYTVDIALCSYVQNGSSIQIKETYDTVSKTEIPVASVATQHVSIDSSRPYVVELETDKNFVTLSGVSGKRITYANVNSTNNAIVASDVRVLAGAVSSAGTVLANISAALDARADSMALRAAYPSSFDMPHIRHFVPPKNPLLVANANREAIVRAADTFDADKPVVGQTKMLYVDTDSSMSAFAQKQFTLRAIGTSESKTICLVWVDDARFKTTGTSQYNSITTEVAQNIADEFAKHYQKERDIFGDEADVMLTASSTGAITMTPMSYTYVNIVVYDIGNDYGKTSQTGIVGYFYSKDYLTNDSVLGESGGRTQTLGFSNEGKYFYVDAAYCNYNGMTNGTASYGGNGNSASKTVISTLFHEFQHMINFNNKSVKYPNRTDVKGTWYDEMLSMLAEDILQKTLNIADADSPKNRLAAFNLYYTASGVTDYLDGEYATISYSTAYAFGAWLMRNYGGPALVKEISTNAEVNMESVVAAVKPVFSPSMTKEQLLDEYVQACMFRTRFAAPHGLPTFNKACSSEINGTTYKVDGINLFSDAYGWKVSNTDNTVRYGPALFSASYPLAVRPNGFVLHAVNSKSPDSDSITLAFSNRKSSSEKVYIYVQDWFETTTKDSTEVAQ